MTINFYDTEGCRALWNNAENYPDIDLQLQRFAQWTKPSEQALWHLFDDCWAPPGSSGDLGNGARSGTAGLASMAVLCTDSGNGVSFHSDNVWQTFAHEVGHNFAGEHSFRSVSNLSNCSHSAWLKACVAVWWWQSMFRHTYVGDSKLCYERLIANPLILVMILSTTVILLPLRMRVSKDASGNIIEHYGGLMDYGSKFYKGVEQFNTEQRKEAMCAHIQTQFGAACTANQVTAFQAACGDGIVDSSEECECVGKSTSCSHCESCKLTGGAQCTPDAYDLSKRACCGNDGMFVDLGSSCTTASEISNPPKSIHYSCMLL